MNSNSVKHSKSGKQTLVVSLLIIVVLLVAARLYAPIAIKDFANDTLNNKEGITGSVGNIHLHLYRGAYEIENIEIYQADLPEVPILEIAHMDISILWSALFYGNIVSEISVYQPSITVLDREDKTDIQNQQIKDEKLWLGLAKDVVPFSIDRVDVYNGVIVFQDAKQSPDNQTRLSSINGQIANITNSRELNDSLVTQFELKGLVMDEAAITMMGEADPFTTKPTFELDVKVEEFPVKFVDALIKRYTPIDLEAGSIDGAVELVVDNGQVDGYVKIGIYDMTVFTWRQDIEQDGDNPFLALFEGAVGLLAEILENDESDLVAARIPVSGTLSETETDTLSAVFSILRNAFIEAVEMDIEDIFSLQEDEESTNDD